MVGSAPEANDAVSMFGDKTRLVRRLGITSRAESNELFRHRSSHAGDYEGASVTARITRPRVPHLEQSSSGSMTKPPRVSKPSVVMATCRSGNARAVAMHSVHTAPRCCRRNSAISLRNVAGTTRILSVRVGPLHRTVKG